jgi:hypothetical protein
MYLKLFNTYTENSRLKGFSGKREDPEKNNNNNITMVKVRKKQKNKSLDKTISHKKSEQEWVRVMVFNTTFNNISVISWWSHLLVEETGVPVENH